ncbi:cytoskeletal protein RodZ [Staphylococcus caledonicus]
MNYLKLERVKRELSQQSVADSIGISRDKYIKFETGKYNILYRLNYIELSNYANLLGFDSIDEFIVKYEKETNQDHVKDLVKNGLF